MMKVIFRLEAEKENIRSFFSLYFEMRKFRIEILISILTIIIGLVVTTIGYLSYKSLTNIVVEIKEGTQPDNKVAQIKDIAANLTLLEQTVRFYVLTNSNDDLEQYYFLEDSIYRQIEILGKLKFEDEFDKVLIDSFIKLSNDKIDLWEKILSTQISNQSFFPSFSQVYSKISERQANTLSGKNSAVSDNFRNSLKAETDTSPYKTLVEVDVRRKIRMLEWEMYKKQKKKNVIESELVEKDVVISGRISELIRMAENKKATDLVKNTEEANKLAEKTIERLTVYTTSAVVLLILTFFVLFIYLRKSRTMSRVLIVAREKAEALAKAKEQFAANVSHELRTPVNSIYGLAEQLQQKTLDPNSAEMVSVIFNSASHLRNIVNDTLDFSKIQSQKLVLDKTGFSPEAVFAEVISLFKNEAIKKGIALVFQWEGEKPAVLVGDSFRLKQMIINLVGNAIKFTDKGEVALKVSSQNSGDKKVELKIQVIDTGIGVEADKINFIFDEYVQIDNPSGKKYKGTGLGLSIVKKLVELHDGQIEFESKPGKGTCVTMRLNYDEGEELELGKVGVIISEIPESLKKISVLIADDEEYNRFLIRNILKKWGIRCIEVKDGNEAIQAVQSERFDLILMDLHMPVTNGIEAARQIRHNNPETTIIAVSATVDNKERQACINAGMKGFLFKPFSEKELFDLLLSFTKTDLQNNQIQPDYSEYIKRFSNLAGGDQKFLEEMIRLFIESMETGISEIDDAIERKKWDVVYNSAHRMAAPLKHIAADKIYSQIKQIEKAAQQKEAGLVVSAYSELKPVIEELLSFLKSPLEESRENEFRSV
jgi:signal transduction histidine kinase/CheY-like chemotaxis protein/CHASE3 domain sensor protein